MTRVLPLLALAACQTSGTLTVPVPELELTVVSPEYGAFTGISPTIKVKGRVNDPAATVWVEGRQANVGVTGDFEVDLPVPRAYRVVDIEAANPKGRLRERVPVFSGSDPLETWPGAMGARVTPLGLQALGDSLEGTFADLGLAQTLFDVLPSIESDGFSFVPTGVDEGTVDVQLTPAASGLDLLLVLEGLAFYADFDIPILGADTLTLGLDRVEIGIEVQPEVDASGMLWLAFGDSTLALSDPTFETGTIDPVILEDLLGGLIGGLGPVLSGALDGLLGGIGALPLGGPFEFELDLLGAPMTFGIDALYGDLDGLALVLGLDIDGMGNGQGVSAPASSEAHWASHAVLSVHEGVFQLLLDSDLFDLFSQDLELGGLFGNILALPITSLSGGEGAPLDATGWCMSIDPGQARVARLQPDAEQLAVIYMPDFRFDIGVQQGSTVCTDWLDASVALEIGFGLQPDGNLDLDIDIGDGAVLAYATTAPYEEDAVIDGLGALLDLAMGFLGGDALGGFNLGDLLGGGGTGLPIGELEILDVRPVHDENGARVEGLMDLSVRIF